MSQFNGERGTSLLTTTDSASVVAYETLVDADPLVAARYGMHEDSEFMQAE